MTETRKLAALLAADIAGYSRLAGADEDRTLSRLRGLRSDLIDPATAVHHGRVVKRTGDGSLIELRSVVDAVRCAIEVQNGRPSATPGSPRTSGSSSASAFISATWSRKPTATSWATASTSPRAWKAFASRARSACQRTPIGRYATGSRRNLSISAKRRSRTS